MRRKGVASGGSCGTKGICFILLWHFIKMYIFADSNNIIERGKLLKESLCCLVLRTQIFVHFKKLIILSVSEYHISLILFEYFHSKTCNWLCIGSLNSVTHITESVFNFPFPFLSIFSAGWFPALYLLVKEFSCQLERICSLTHLLNSKLQKCLIFTVPFFFLKSAYSFFCIGLFSYLISSIVYF